MAGQGRGAKVKGSKFERKTAGTLGKWWGYQFNRTPGSGGLRWAGDNNVAGDIVAPPEANFPFIVECKNHEGWTWDTFVNKGGELGDWWRQVTEDCERVGRTPMLVFTRNYANEYVCIPYIESVYDKLSHEGEVVVRTTIQFKDLLGNHHYFDVLVTDIKGLTNQSKRDMINWYSTDKFDWRTIRTIDTVDRGEVTPDDLLNMIK